MLQTPHQPTGRATELLIVYSTRGRRSSCYKGTARLAGGRFNFTLMILIHFNGDWSNWSEICNTRHNVIGSELDMAESADLAGDDNVCVRVCRLVKSSLVPWKLRKICWREKEFINDSMLFSVLDHHYPNFTLNLIYHWTNNEDERLCFSSSHPTLIHKSLSGSLSLYDTVRLTQCPIGDTCLAMIIILMNIILISI